MNEQSNPVVQQQQLTPQEYYMMHQQQRVPPMNMHGIPPGTPLNSAQVFFI